MEFSFDSFRGQPLLFDIGRKCLKISKNVCSTSVQKFLTVFELFGIGHFRGRPRNSLMGSFIVKMKSAYC